MRVLTYAEPGGTNPEPYVWTVMNRAGTPVDLTDDSFPVDSVTVEYRINGGSLITVDGDMVDLATGKIGWTPGSTPFTSGGILEGTAYYYAGDDRRVGAQFQITITRAEGSVGGSAPVGGPSGGGLVAGAVAYDPTDDTWPGDAPEDVQDAISELVANLGVPLIEDRSAGTGGQLGDTAITGGGATPRDFTVISTTSLLARLDAPSPTNAGDLVRTVWLDPAPSNAQGSITGVDLPIAVAAGLDGGLMIARMVTDTAGVLGSVQVLSGGDGFSSDPTSTQAVKTDGGASSQVLRFVFAPQPAGTVGLQIGCFDPSGGATFPRISIAKAGFHWLQLDETATALANAPKSAEQITYDGGGLDTGNEDVLTALRGNEGRWDGLRIGAVYRTPVDPGGLGILGPGDPVTDGDTPAGVNGRKPQPGELALCFAEADPTMWCFRLDENRRWINTSDPETGPITNALATGISLGWDIPNRIRATWVYDGAWQRSAEVQDPAAPGSWTLELVVPLPDVDAVDGTTLQIVGGVPAWVEP